jgi:hypothetical protein
MRILEALRIIEDAVYECKMKSIDRADIGAALDLLHAHVGAVRRQIEDFVEHYSRWSHVMRQLIPPQVILGKLNSVGCERAFA